MKTTKNAVSSAKPKKVVKAGNQPSKLSIRRLEYSDDLVIIDLLLSIAARLDPFTAKLIADILRTSARTELARFADKLEEAFDDYKLRNPGSRLSTADLIRSSLSGSSSMTLNSELLNSSSKKDIK